MKKALPEVIDALYAEAEHLYKAKNNKTAVRNYIARINPDYRITTDNGFFEKDDLGRYYLSGYPVEVPTTLLEAIRNRIRSGADYTHLIEFWKLLMINPEANVRKHLFDYCSGSEKGFEITSAGYLLGFVRCRLNHNVKALEKYMRSMHRTKEVRDDTIYMQPNGSYINHQYGNAVEVGIVRHLYRDLVKDEFSKIREAQTSVFRAHNDLRNQLQIGQINSTTTIIQGSLDENLVTAIDIVVMVMFNPANVNDVMPTGLVALECFPYGAAQKTMGADTFDIVGETLMEVDYMQQDFYNMQSLLEEARGLVGGRTILLTPAEIKRILDSRKFFVDKPKKE